jgi:SAM-dependent methyltransferase
MIAILCVAILGGIMGQISYATDDHEKLISHHGINEINLKNERERLYQSSSLTLSLDETLELLDQVNEFELGKFLLRNKGLNGFWTAYIILKAREKQLTHPLEHWVIHHAPAVRATQERYQIFQQEIQKRLHSNMTLVSLPCGLMDDLLSLDYKDVNNIHLIGIDLDSESLDLGQQNERFYNKPVAVTWQKKNAWQLKVPQEYDLVTSNGLNIYEPDDYKVIELYKNIWESLKPGGTFITSFLTPPPTLSKESPWKNVKLDDVIKQKALFSDVLQVKWQVFRTEAQIRDHLTLAGFNVVDVICDSRGLFPTIICEKPCEALK